MRGFFSMDGGLFTFLNKVFDIGYLSILWIIFSLPIVTIGASTTALYYTTVKVIRKGRGYVFREFFDSFRLNLKQGILYTLIIIAAVAIFGVNFEFSNAISGTGGKVLFGIYIALAYLCICCATYLFPVLSRFTGSFGHTLKTSLLLSVKHYPYTVVLQIIFAAAVVLTMYIPILIILMPAAGSATYSLMMEKVLIRYIPKDEEDVSDAWYFDHDAR
ncbi:hypothetical protein lbkm_2676 [Lachnospiraceae bacterium KM106-2]|nr:hypothetical protein lbkm_2676 [Lachnospiraceae bacterium KM106-2]